MKDSGVIDKTAMVFGQMNEAPGPPCIRVALTRPYNGGIFP